MGIFKDIRDIPKTDEEKEAKVDEMLDEIREQAKAQGEEEFGEYLAKCQESESKNIIKYNPPPHFIGKSLLSRTMTFIAACKERDPVMADAMIAAARSTLDDIENGDF